MESKAINPSTGGLSEFFRYHGVWAPGVRLFRKIGFRTKAMVISSAFVVPLAVLGWNYFVDKAASIDFSAKERVGVRYAQALTRVTDRLQTIRLGDQAAVSALQADVDALAAVDKDTGEALGTTRLHKTLEGAVQAARQAAGRTDVYDAAAAAALDLLGQSTDGSNLTLDPDIDTYYLMDATMFRLLPMTDDIVRIVGLGRQVAADAAQSAQQQRRIIERLADLRMHAGAVQAGLAKAVAYNPALQSQLPYTDAMAAIEKFAAAVDARWLSAGDSTSRPDAAAVEASARQALEGADRLRGQAVTALDQLITARVDAQASARNATAVLLAASLIVVLYLFTAFRKVLDGGLREVGFHICAMRDGNLTTRPNPWGADEAARLMLTLEQMQSSLRQIVTDVRGASDHIVHASSEIAAGSTDLSARTERTASSLQESASAMEQIAATSAHNAQIISEASSLAQANAESAREGGAVVASVVRTMGEIETSSKRIGDIVGVIDGIAFQTNILALNAAVEAARAGEAGRGFAVVATEVRQLAQRAAGSAREIRSLIADSLDKVESGSKLARVSGDSIERIVSEAQRVNELLGDVARGAAEQATGVSQTTQAVQDMDATTQQNAALVEQTAAAAASLTDQARALVARVATFQLA